VLIGEESTGWAGVQCLEAQVVCSSVKSMGAPIVTAVLVPSLGSLSCPVTVTVTSVTDGVSQQFFQHVFRSALRAAASSSQLPPLLKLRGEIDLQACKALFLHRC
jgi:hypothetical protein